ncbi:MAG: hypothetical protein HOH58_03320 [Opitutaceae bacterium]|jgi:predicted phosphodiesterase|nr:hypothetical protein [Opitutaceae bacterium]
MLRILSDLHFRDATSRLERLEDLLPLLEGVTELWLNGDTCDNQSGMTAAELAEIKEFFTAHVPRVRFITGNHDPDISEEHEASAAHGRIWACHGDACLDDIVPWSRVRETLVDRINEIRSAHPELNYTSFEDRVRIMRMACTGFARECDPEKQDSWHLLRRICTEFFPPRQPWAMVHTWATFGTRAATAAAIWRPEARVIVSGHVHFPRIWQRGDRTVINTGAFTGPLGAYVVEYAEKLVTVRRIESRDRRWHPGKIVSTIPLASK